MHIRKALSSKFSIDERTNVSEIGHRKEELDTPFLWVDLDTMERNIEQLSQYFAKAGVNWRPHTKGVKVPAIAHRAISAGAIGVTCAKLGEAEVMVASGIRDILVANQVVGRHKITRLANLCRQADVIVAVDDAENIAAIGQAAVEKDTEVGVLVEVETGMERAGVAPGQAAVELSLLAAGTEGINYQGVMAWEGHAVGVFEPAEKREIIEKSIGLLVQSAEMCREAGLEVPIVSGGGSGTYKVTPFLSGITEIQAGGAIFNDPRYSLRHVETDICIFVRSMVTSRPTTDRLIFDAGFKALPSLFGEPVVMGISDVEEVATSAEHLVMKLSKANSKVHVGEAFDFQLGYIDATLFLHDFLYGVRNGIVETVWPILGRGKLR